MLKVLFVQPDGQQVQAEAVEGMTAMEAALRAGVVGIEAECGGACSCATCHVYVDEAWREAAGSPSGMEEDMLDFAYDVRPQSRLSCQIRMTDALDGLVLQVPARQA